MNQRIIGITGWKNSGKTTLTERLVKMFTARGLKVSTIKHAHHAFDVDKEGTDSFRHRAAGAGEVAIVSNNRWVLMHELRDESEPGLKDILARLSPCDLVIIEGYKRGTHLKIETRRREGRAMEPLASEDPNIIAIASDQALSGETLPVFAIDDIAAIADFIAARLGLADPNQEEEIEWQELRS